MAIFRQNQYFKLTSKLSFIQKLAIFQSLIFILEILEAKTHCLPTIVTDYFRQPKFTKPYSWSILAIFLAKMCNCNIFQQYFTLIFMTIFNLIFQQILSTFFMPIFSPYYFFNIFYLIFPNISTYFEQVAHSYFAYSAIWTIRW